MKLLIYVCSGNTTNKKDKLIIRIGIPKDGKILKPLKDNLQK